MAKLGEIFSENDEKIIVSWKFYSILKRIFFFCTKACFPWNFLERNGIVKWKSLDPEVGLFL